MTDDDGGALIKSPFKHFKQI